MLYTIPVKLPPRLSSILAVTAGDAADFALPRPHGWIGTSDDWARGLGIAFVALAVALLALAWSRLRRAGLTPGLKELLVLPLVVLPLAIVFFGYSYGIESSKSIGSCGSCHVMKAYLADLKNPDSDTVAATTTRTGTSTSTSATPATPTTGCSGRCRPRWKASVTWRGPSRGDTRCP